VQFTCNKCQQQSTRYVNPWRSPRAPSSCRSFHTPHSTLCLPFSVPPSQFQSLDLCLTVTAAQRQLLSLSLAQNPWHSPRAPSSCRSVPHSSFHTTHPTLLIPHSASHSPEDTPRAQCHCDTVPRVVVPWVHQGHLPAGQSNTPHPTLRLTFPPRVHPEHTITVTLCPRSTPGVPWLYHGVVRTDVPQVYHRCTRQCAVGVPGCSVGVAWWHPRAPWVSRFECTIGVPLVYRAVRQHRVQRDSQDCGQPESD